MKLLRSTIVAISLIALVTPILARGDSAPALKYKVGDIAPDFTLRDQNGKQVSLHDFRGKKNVVLAFYVFAFSGG